MHWLILCRASYVGASWEALSNRAQLSRASPSLCYRIFEFFSSLRNACSGEADRCFPDGYSGIPAALKWR